MKEFTKGYYITKEGKIYSNIGNKGLKERKTHLINGYPSITIRKKVYKVHRLVAKYFLPKVEGKGIINHKDGNKQNNNVANLEWCTQKENAQHAWDNGLCSRQRPTQYKPVYKIDMTTFEIVTEYESITVAEQHNPKAKGHIASCCTGNRSNASGYYWIYKEDYDKDKIKEKINLKNTMCGKHNPAAKRVLCITTGEIFETLKDAADKYKISSSNISSCCRGKLKTTGGKQWEYVE